MAERMFAALAAESINMKMITTGDIKISVLVARDDAVKALRAVHNAFELHRPRPRAGGAGVVQPSEFKPRPTTRGAEAERRELVNRLQRLSGMEDVVVDGVDLNAEHGRITIFGLPDQPGNCSRVFQAVATGGIIVDMIVQNLTDGGRAELSFSVPRGDLTRALIRTQDVVRAIDPQAKVVGESDIAVLFVYGVGMRTHTGVARKMFGALAERGININLINTSETCVSVVVERARGEEALACLREAFQVQ